MRLAIVGVGLCLAATAQVTIPPGTPLRVALEQRVRIKRVGDRVVGRLVEPVYVVDRLALPAGTLVEGHIAEIGGVPVGRRVAALFSGNLFPARDARAQFDTADLGDGSRVTLRTAAAAGTAHTAIVTKTEKDRRAVRDRVAGMSRAAVLAFRTPGKMSRLKARLFAMLPYHRQAWRAGTLFDAALKDPLTVTGSSAAAPDGAQELRVRLLHAISSAKARKGDPVEAVVSRPYFGADGTLLVPEGSRLSGEVVEARRARFLHRNGKLLFTFRQIRLEGGASRTVQAYVERMEADDSARLMLDAEGGARVSNPKTRFIFPAVAAAVAGLSLHQDYNSQGVADQDIGGRAESGAVGLGLIGTGVAQISREVASGIAFAGAGFSVWSAVLARGAEVALPANTPLEVSVRARAAKN